MSTLLKRILIFALWVLYMLLMWFFFKPHFEANCCADTTADDTTLFDPSVNTHALASRWDTTGLFEGPGFDSLRAAILSQRGENNILEIIGYYYEGEATPEGAESMGLARAAKIRELYFADIPDDRIKLSARPFGANDRVKVGYFPAGNFNWIQPEDKVKETVEVFADSTIVIRFPYNSTEKVYDAKVDSFLVDLAAEMKATGELVELTGHTDNTGNPEYNQDLGLRRADAIKDILVELGADESLITTISKGETLPVDTNNTEEGRSNNRRVVVVRIPKPKEEDASDE